MPELPEVETIRLTLKPKIQDRTIVAAEIILPKLIQDMTVEEFRAQIRQKKIVGIERRGKYLLIKLSADLVLAFHLRMTGQLIVEPAEATSAKATYLRFLLDDGKELRYRDQRKFGRVFLFAAGNAPLSLRKLGPEPLGTEFNAAVLKQRFSGCKMAVKKALLDQEIIAGIGNIYADEALFLAGIHPARPVPSLTDDEYQQLYQAIRQVLTEGIAYRGTTKRDYRDGEGNPGSYQDHLRVYGRKGLTCERCHSTIVKMNFAGRGTHFCPLCQK
ncbi:MAG: DNA-formamidopyrimidine glycosylase [Bacillota bacterium]